MDEHDLPSDLSPEQRQAFELKLRSMSWRTLTSLLMQAVEQHHLPVELPAAIRHWFELNRNDPRMPEEAQSIVARLEAEVGASWGSTHTESLPISGWVVRAAHFFLDGERWWLFAARRHDDAAPLAGPTAPAPANQLDLKKLGKIVAYAGGDPRRELLRTGAITREEHDAFIAAGKPDVAEYGQIFFWWRAR